MPEAIDPVSTTPTSPFHEGEQQVQERLGVRDEIEPWARRVVRPYLPEEHRAFYAQLPFLVLAARDGAGRPWATLVADEPGFVSSPDPETLRIAARPSTGDALADALHAGDDVGLLGIELHTRRRNRVNGRLGADGEALCLSVEQAFGNCPQYISERSWQRAQLEGRESRSTRSDELSPEQRDAVVSADTFFIATGHRGDGHGETFGMDASHRGGTPGFVRVESAREIVFPDYAGNNHFNTIGNLEMDPRAGLVFVDFESGDLLQLTGRARIDWDSDAIARFPGARRLVYFDVEEVVAVSDALPLRWELEGGSARELRVVAKLPESADVTSFLFASRDGGELPEFLAGQYLPIELSVPDEHAPVSRTYSLSGAPSGEEYRISVKRDPRGLASRFLHDQLEAGGIITARAPQGSFTLDDASERPVVLVSAGVGVTPFVSMLHDQVEKVRQRTVWFVHGARDGAHHPLGREVERLVQSSPSAGLHVAYSRPGPDDVAGRDFDSEGRVDGALLESLVPDLDADFYVCGPAGFMASIESELEARGVPAERIRTESFGAAGA